MRDSNREVTNFLEGLFRLDGKVCLVTGAGSGLGKAIAIGFAHYGADLALADVKLADVELVAEEVRKLGRRAIAIHCDVRYSSQVDAMVSRVLEEMRSIDVLVNSAGIARRRPAEAMTDEDWDILLDINLRGTFLCCRAVGRVMLEQGGGRIINLSSIGGVVGLPGGNASYGASKAGIIGLTRTLAIEWANRSVLVNALAPCHFRTPLIEESLLKDPQASQRIRKAIPLGRVGEPEEIVGPAVFLASNASRMVTGHVLMVDGGMSAA